MIKSQIISTVIPSWLITYKLTDFQFRLFTLLEYFRYTNTKDLTSDFIAEYLGKHRDTVRRELNRFNQIFPDEFLKVHFVKNGLNTNHKIVIDWRYINNRTEIQTEQTNINSADKYALTHFLKNSRYFSNHNADEITKIKSDFENLIKALLYVDTCKDVKNPIRYLRSCFKNGIFKYDKRVFDLETLNVDKKEIKQRMKKLTRIDSNLMYGITHDAMDLINIAKKDHYVFYGIKDAKFIYLYRCTYKTKEANVKNTLEKYQIPFQIFVR